MFGMAKRCKLIVNLSENSITRNLSVLGWKKDESAINFARHS